MAYICQLSETHSIYLENLGEQTVITTTNSSPGQQQQSSSSFTTGNWTKPPQVFPASGGVAIAISGSRGDCTIQVRGNSIAVTSDRVSVANAQQLHVQQVANVPTSTMPPMEP
ncbi:MAG: zinc ribbon domain-containing protein, partial [Cyanobacteria bacterium J055]